MADTLLSDSTVRIIYENESEKTTKELQRAVSSAAFMGATQGAEKRVDALMYAAKLTAPWSSFVVFSNSFLQIILTVETDITVSAMGISALKNVAAR